MPENKTKIKKRPMWVNGLRWLLFSTLGFILFLVLAWVGLQTRWAKNRLAGLVASATADSGAYRVTLEGLDGLLPFSIILDRVVVSDGDGAWLEARKTNISLRPAALLAGILEAEWFRVEGLSMIRLPRSIKGPPEKKKAVSRKGNPLSLPHVMVREIRINRIDLGREVAGEAMSYNLQSEVETRDRLVEARVVLQDIRHRGDALHLKTQYDLGTRRISTQLTYRESPGGLVAGLMNLKDAKGIRLHLKADGPLSRVEGNLGLEMGGYGRADLDYQVGLNHDITVAVEGQIRAERRIVPEHVAAALGGLSLDIECRAVLSPQDVLRIKRFMARAPFTAISMEGTADLVKGDMDVQAIASPLDISPFLRGSGLEHKALGPVRLTAKGPFSQPEMTVATTVGAIRANGTTLEDVTLEVRAGLEKDFKGLIESGVSLTAQKVRVPQAKGFKGPLRVDMAAKSPDFTTWHIETLHLTAPDVDVHVDGARIDTAGGNFSADLRARINNIAVLLPPEAPDVDGRLVMRARAEGNTTTRQIGADLNLTLTQLSGLPPMAAGTIGPDLTVNTRATMKNDILKLEQTHLTGGHTDLKVDGWLNTEKGAFDVEYHLLLNDLPAMDKAMGVQLEGNVETRGRIAGGLEDFAAHIDLSSKQLRVNDLHLKDLHTRLEAKGLPKRPAGSIRLEGSALDQPLRLNAGFAWSGETLALSQAEATLPGIDLNADLEITPAKKHLSGTAQGEIKSLKLLRAISGLEARGSGGFRLKAGGPAQDMGVTLDAHFKDLRYKGYGISTLKIKALLDDLTPVRGQVDIDATDVAVQGVRLRTMKFGAKGSPDGAVVNLEAKGSTFETIHGGAERAPVSLTTRLHVEHREMWRLRLDLLKAAYKNLDVNLPHPATLTMGDGKIVLDDLQLQTAKGRLQAKAQLNRETVQVSARITDLPLALLEPFIGRDLTGVATVKLDLSGPLADPAVRVGVHIREHRIPGRDGKAPLLLEARLDSRRQKDLFVVEAELSGLGTAPFTARGSVPARLSLRPFAFKVDKDKALTGKLQGRLDLAVLQGLSAMSGQTLRGHVDVDMGVGGSLEKWVLNGGTTISQGHYENVALGVVLADINGRMDASGRTLRLTRLTAIDGGTGTMALEGGITMETPFPMDVDLTFKQATLLRKETLTTTASGKLDLKGDIKRFDLTGKIILDRTEVAIPKRLPPDVVVIPVREINLPPGMRTEGIQPGQDFKSLFMDLSVEIPARFFVRGRGLDAEFMGQLTARGPADNPVVRGTLKVVRGTFQFMDHTFQVTNGQIAFDGTTPPVPFLNITTQVNAGKIDAQVRVTGPADAFKLTLSSQPPLPQDEIMANILFGRSVAKLNAFQAYQLASSLSQLSGGDMPDFVGETRRLLGVDRLSISGGDDGSGSNSGPNSGPALSAGKYVSEDVYVGVEQDLTDAKQDVVVEVDITPNFSVESKAGTKSGAGIGLNWKYDY